MGGQTYASNPRKAQKRNTVHSCQTIGGQPLEKGEDFEYFPVEHELEGAEGPPAIYSQKGRGPCYSRVG